MERPETLIELSKQADNLRSIMNSMSDRYLDATCQGRQEEWKKAVIAIIDCFCVGNEVAKREDKS